MKLPLIRPLLKNHVALLTQYAAGAAVPLLLVPHLASSLGLEAFGALSVTLGAMLGAPVAMPDRLRDVAFVLIGMSMGASVAPDSLTLIASWPISIAALAVELVTIGFFAYATQLFWRYTSIVARERMVTIDLPRNIVFYAVFAAFLLMFLRAVVVFVRAAPRDSLLFTKRCTALFARTACFDSSTACRITLRSSRTLPGQS